MGASSCMERREDQKLAPMGRSYASKEAPWGDKGGGRERFAGEVAGVEARGGCCCSGPLPLRGKGGS